jgi:uncharacterized phiE125 gp8 family phage protein
MLAPVRVIPPAELPVSLEEAKAHLRIDFGDDDFYVAGLIEAATAHLDGWSGILGRALVTQTWRQDLCGFPCDGVIRLPLAPVQAVTAITYRDEVGADMTLDPGVTTEVMTDALGPFVRLRGGQSWPATAQGDDAVSVVFTAGYGASSAVPQAIRHAILLLVGHWHATREPVNIGNITSNLDFAVTALLAPFRRVGL